MNAFWGVPTSVATLPTVAAIATATRYGSGFTRKARVPRITTGVTSIATAGRSIGKRRTVRKEIRTYVTRKTTVAATRAYSAATSAADGAPHYGTLRGEASRTRDARCPITLK